VVTQAQLEKLSSLYSYVASVEGNLGSEAGAYGEVLTLTQQTFDAARKAAFPKGYLFVPQKKAAFEKRYSVYDGVPELLAFLKPFKPEYALIGEPGTFDPDDANGDRGGFFVCMFLHSKAQLGWNVLIRFDRAET